MAELPPPRRALTRALFHREWRASSLAVALVLMVAGATMGRLIAARGLLPGSTGANLLPAQAIGSLGDFALWMLSRALPIPIAIIAGVVAIERLAADRDSPWLDTLAAAGMDRGHYVVVSMAAMASWQLVLYAALAAGYVAGSATLSVEAGALALRMLRGLPFVAAFLASVTLYGAGCIALARRQGPALALALAGVVAPIAVLGWLRSDDVHAVSPLAANLIGAASPLMAWTDSTAVLLRHTLYCVVLLTLLSRSAPSWVARHG